MIINNLAVSKLFIKNGKIRFTYYLLNLTWGLPLTIIGYILLLLLLPFGKVKKFLGVPYLEFKKQKGWGFSIGIVSFVTKNPSISLLEHEFGHSVQNAIFGPFTLFIISLPSVIRFHYRELKTMITNNLPKKPYDSIWFEKSATIIGMRYNQIIRDYNTIVTYTQEEDKKIDRYF